LAFPLGLAYFVGIVVGMSLSAALSILLIGVPLFLSVLVCCHLGAGLERLTARYLLGVDIVSPGYPFLDVSGTLPRVRALVLGAGTWIAMGYLLSKFAIGIVAFVLLTTLLSVSVSLLLTPLYYDEPGVSVGVHLSEPITLTPSIRIPWGELLIGVDFALAITSWEVTTLGGALLASAIGVVSLVLSLNVLNGFAWLVGRFTRFALGASDPSVLTLIRTDS
jgi:hypothetical protein